MEIIYPLVGFYFFCLIMFTVYRIIKNAGLSTGKKILWSLGSLVLFAPIVALIYLGTKDESKKVKNLAIFSALLFVAYLVYVFSMTDMNPALDMDYMNITE